MLDAKRIPDLPGRRWNKLISSANRLIPKNEVIPPVTEKESELYDDLLKGVKEGREKYGETFAYDDTVEIEW